MKTVINIPDKLKKLIDNGSDLDLIDMALIMYEIRRGTPLPKGHDRLIDSKALGDYFWEHRSRLFTHKDLQSIIDHAPTILEADKEGE